MKGASPAKWPINDDAADRLAGPHQVEAFTDVLQRELMGGQIVDVDLLLHVPIDDLWHVGASLGTTKAVAFHTRPVTGWNGRAEIF